MKYNCILVSFFYLSGSQSLLFVVIVIRSTYSFADVFLLCQEDMKKKAALEEKKDDPATAEDAKGIPEFWLTIFKHVDMLGEMLQVKHLLS